MPRNKKKEPTRDRMLEAAAELLRNEGPAALTTVRVTKAAGIVQSGFYAHFRNPDHLNEALAERIGAAIDEVLPLWLDALAPLATAGGQTAFGDLLDHFAQAAPLVDLMLRYRRGEGPLAEALRARHTQFRAAIFELLRRRTADPPAQKLGILGMHADVVVSAVLGVAEGLLDGTIADRDLAASELFALFDAPLARLLS